MTTFVEFNPCLINQNVELIDQLAQVEQTVKDLKGKRADRHQRNQAEERAKQLRRKLINNCEPAALYFYFKATEKADANLFRSAWQESYSETSDQQWLSLFNAVPDMQILPTGSSLIQFTLKLLKPYLSRDDNEFHIIDNPLLRERVFRWPMVRPSGWKGSLRHALRRLGYEENDKQILRIFGETRDDDTGCIGRLYLYTTFFCQSSLAIINPHDRKEGVGRHPILMECVPIGAKGEFALLYVPIDRIGEDEQEFRHQVTEDLQLLIRGLKAMMTTYGFGAKTSSGFGLAELADKGSFVVNCFDVAERPVQPTAPTLPESVRIFRDTHPDENFNLKPKAWHEKHHATKREREDYKKAKADWLAYQGQLANYQQQSAEWKKEEKIPSKLTTTRSFTSFVTLETEVEGLARRWQRKAGDA